MLKWTVMNRRSEFDVDQKSDMRRRSTAGSCTAGTPALADGATRSAGKPKRRRSSASRRSAPRRSTGTRRNSLDLDKENRYTSTPIKGSEDAFQADAFRDVSNLTPTLKKAVASPKKKKRCVNPSHNLDSTKYFTPFETVDSHIGEACFAPSILPPFSCLKLCPPNVNDFLQQISIVTSPEEGRPRFNGGDIKVSPLVQRLVDLKFREPPKLDGSSMINELSLDKLVDAILDNSQQQNELNESQEDNLINAEVERAGSADSGFRSNGSHGLDANYVCKCNVLCNRTIINLEGTFNERCVDVSLRRKRSSPLSPEEDVGGKRIILDPTADFSLKRQKCIRRRRTEEVKKVLQNFSDLSDRSYSSDSEANLHGTYVVEPQEPRRTRRCLSFGEEGDEGSVLSAGSSRCREVHGSVELEMQYRNDEVHVTIFRCSELRRGNGLPVNAYVKVALSEKQGDGRRKQKGTLQRTPVQANSSSPIFNHVFRVPLLKSDLQKLLRVEVWHRDRASRRSEFLGCISFVIKNAIKKNISGTYRLLPQSSARCRTGAHPVTSNHHTNNHRVMQQQQQGSNFDEMCESQSSVEDDLPDCDLLKKSTSTTKAALSQQQKDADENLFLRYLELDPLEGPDAAPAAAQRKASGNKMNGRTPFTITKVLRRPPKTGFGFSVVWTHPPRIERVEKGLPADKAGILPGDYLIFVDKHNVVMMPEVEILNLIRSFGNTLNLEIFRRDASRNGSVPSVRRLTANFETSSSTGLPPAPPSTATTQRRPSTVCSTNTASVEYNRKKLHLPQVTFSAERPTNSAEEARRKAMYQILAREQQYATALQFALARFVSALAERKDLIGPAEHRILFQNSDELLRITEDVLDHLVQDDGDYQTHLLLRTYHAKLGEITSSYKRYCSGIKKADCVLANLVKNQEFVRFLQTPAVPRRRPDITVFIHKPLEHYREVLKLFNVILTHTKPNHEDYIVINQIVHELQVSYREMTSEAGLMEPMGEGRPLLSVQDLENRLVFTKCKPFVLTKPGRQWIFGGDLSRVEGRTVRQYWALLFSDILLFAKVSRDRVLFILEDPLPLAHITDFFFNVRKKANEFRIIVEPGGRTASSPTVHCGPDLSRTPRKNPTKRCVILRTPTVELKAVWQNLLQRQIFHVNAGMDGSSYSSPLESPEAPITSSVVTLQSAESLSLRRQVRLSSGHCSEPVVDYPTAIATATALPQPPTLGSLSKTPDTPSANISPSSSGQSQAFTSHFTSECSLLPRAPNEPSTPSAILTPSTDASDALNSEDIDPLKFDEEPWDIVTFEYEFDLDLDEYFERY